MKNISFKETGLKYTLSPHDEPVVKIDPGETLVIETEDACSGQIRKSGDRRNWNKIPFSNPVVGPIYIKGAEENDTISISIENIEPTIDQGTTYFDPEYVTGTTENNFLKTDFPREPKICEIKDGKIHFSNSITIPYKPMIGTIGVAPHLEKKSSSSSVSPDQHGGNIDISEVSPKNTIFLPVFHEGGLLYIGDIHATQGDGEICGTALEMPAKTELKVNLHKEKSINWPRIKTENKIMTVATTSNNKSLQDSIRIAYQELVNWMEEDYGLEPSEGLMLCSQVGKIRIGNLWTVGARIEKRYLNL